MKSTIFLGEKEFSFTLSPVGGCFDVFHDCVLNHPKISSGADFPEAVLTRHVCCRCFTVRENRGDAQRDHWRNGHMYFKTTEVLVAKVVK